MISKKLTVIASLLCSFVLFSCSKGDPTTCKGWTKKLKSPVKAGDAVRNLGDMRCKDSIPKLEELFTLGSYQSEILQAIKAIHEPAASVSILKKGLAIPEVSSLASSVVEDFNLKELVPDLMNILNGDKDFKGRKNALQALVKIEETNLAAYEDLLIKLVRDDPNVQGVMVNALAAESLGKIKSKKAVNHLIIGMFMQTQKGEKFYTKCRKALNAIGSDAVEPLLDTLKGNNPELKEYAQKTNMHGWQWTDSPEVMQVIGDLRDTKAVAQVVENLGKELVMPVGVDAKVVDAWKVTEQNRITMCMIALGNFGDDSVITKAKDIILNTDNDAKQRLDTATALALIGSDASISALLDIYSKEKDSRFRAPLLVPLSLALNFKNLAQFDKIASGEKSELVLDRLKGDSLEAKEIKDYLSVVRDCKDDLSCLLEKLKTGTPLQQKKAAISLAHIGNKDTLDDLIERYPATSPQDVDLRRFLMMGFWRMGDRNLAAELQKLIAADKEKKGAGYWVDEMEALAYALERK
ncbi:MAG: HEAT repeat domain-containing protein [Deltaproteobacteria bacterium]|nr:HEAT repeat domain-containing protein [Deltaproteobacteria bacterium]